MIKDYYAVAPIPFAARFIDRVANLFQKLSWRIYDWNNKRRARAINEEIRKSKYPYGVL